MSEQDRSTSVPPSRPKYVDSPEFKAILDEKLEERVNAMLPGLMAQVAEAHARATATIAEAATEKVAEAASGSQQKDINFVQSLALQLAELTGQGRGRIYVAPAVVERRRQALVRLRELLIELYARKEIPTYRLKSKVYLNLGAGLGEALLDPLYRDNARIVQPTELDWVGIPNLAMMPINSPAERVWALFCEWIGHQGADSAVPDEMIALNSHGAVVRGEAARVILQNDKGAREMLGASAEMGDDGMPAAVIRRHDQSPKTKVQVLGTLTKPVEVS